MNLSYYALAKVDKSTESSCIFLTGGYDSERKNSARVFVFRVDDPESSAWIIDPQQPNINTPRSHHSSCALGTKVYILCGFDES